MEIKENCNEISQKEIATYLANKVIPKMTKKLQFNSESTQQSFYPEINDKQRQQRKLQKKTGENGFCYVFHNTTQKEIIITVNDKTWRYNDHLPLKCYLEELPEGSKIFINDSLNISVNNNTKLELSFKPDRILKIGEKHHRIVIKIQFLGIENWLRSLGLPNLIYTFYEHYIDDFLVLPFLTDDDLTKMNIAKENKKIILNSVEKIRNHGNSNCKYCNIK